MIFRERTNRDMKKRLKWTFGNAAYLQMTNGKRFSSLFAVDLYFTFNFSASILFPANCSDCVGMPIYFPYQLFTQQNRAWTTNDSFLVKVQILTENEKQRKQYSTRKVGSRFLIKSIALRRYRFITLPPVRLSTAYCAGKGQQGLIRASFISSRQWLKRLLIFFFATDNRWHLLSFAPTR